MAIMRIFYLIKPIVPRSIQIFLRRILTRLKRSRFSDIWPIDNRSEEPPIEWKGWPNQKRFALVLTHDVESNQGHEKCEKLMRLEQELGFRSSFNFVPERYFVSSRLRYKLTANGFEVGVHGLNHDGKLYASEKIFNQRSERINHYLKEWDAVGFRSPAMHHNFEWIHQLNIEYDASTFDTDPFEPQPDGVGTIFPFFVDGKPNRKGYVELPYTLPQDYTLFILMKEKNIDIWKKKLDWIAQKGGMALINTHPDYMNFINGKFQQEEYPVQYYENFLKYIKSEYNGHYWNVLSKDLSQFWREKAKTSFRPVKNNYHPIGHHKKNIRMPAVVLSGHTMGLGVIRSLGSQGVPVITVSYEKKDMGQVSKYAKKSIHAPHPEESENQFINLLIDQAKHSGRGVLIPTDDTTLVSVSKNKTLLEEYYHVACTDWDVTKKFLDKSDTYKIAEQIGVPSPRTLTLMCIAELEANCTNFKFPCLVKPFYSHRYFERFGEKMSVVKNYDEMFTVYKQAVQFDIPVMIQELIPGGDEQGVNYNSFFWNGETLIEFTAQKIRYSQSGFGVPRVVRSRIHIPEVQESAKKILQTIQFNGYSCIEFKKDPRDGIYKLMEVNGRFNRSGLLSLKCGINFPWLVYKHLIEGKLPQYQEYMPDVYWIDEFKDMADSIKPLLSKHYTFKQFIQPYLNPNIFAVFDKKDLMPFLKRFYDIFKMGLSISNYQLIK